eukprot:1142986-Pelagomonas_calceolata.AAC.2
MGAYLVQSIAASPKWHHGSGRKCSQVLVACFITAFILHFLLLHMVLVWMKLERQSFPHQVDIWLSCTSGSWEIIVKSQMLTSSH